ncbi:MAG TPA: LamG-like jellyroll fold domain-containing protein [Candidatus Limnocylindria bacterium]|nr:LamG-like jellyroll fold domain-containing protein [Candidatus Limnocylindria bacterium]
MISLRRCGSLGVLRSWLITWLVLLASSSSARAAQTFVKDLSSSGNVVVMATAAHPTDSSIYVIGTFSDTPLTIGTKTLPLVGGRTTGFIAKMGPDGAWRWAGTLAETTGGGSLIPRAVAVGANKVYVCGDSINGLDASIQNGAATFRGGLTLNNVSRAPFVASFDTEGRYVWGSMASNSEAASGGSDAFAYDLTVDGVGNVFVCGSFRSDQITDNTSLGLNFGPYHAFRVRDTSGTPGSTDWSYTTRDGFVAKLDSSGAWRWVATGGSLEDAEGGFFSIAVDDVSTVYVMGNARSGRNCFGGALINAYCTASQWNASGLPAANYGPDVPTDNVVAYVARIGGSGSSTDGKWLANGLALATGSKVGTGCPAWGSIETRARNVAWVKGSVYAVYYDQSNTDLKVARIVSSLSAVEAIATITGSAVCDASSGTSLGFAPSGELYLSGWIGAPQASFTSASGQAFTATTSLPQSPFVAKLTGTNLSWGWVKLANTPNLPNALPTFGPLPNTVDPQSGRVFVAGSFNKGILDLGPDVSDTVLPPDGSAQGSNSRGFVAAVLPTGEFLEQVQLTIETAFGADSAQPPQTPQTVFKGTSLTASVPAILFEDAVGARINSTNSDQVLAQAVVRHICIGYEMLGTAIAGDAPGFSFQITEDTRLRFNWRTEYALEIKNDLSGSLGGLTSTAAGSPDPVVQKHWVAEGTLTTAFIDGVIASPNPNELGTRYRSTGYQASGAGTALGVLTNVIALNGVDEYVDLGTLPALSFTNGLTLEAWVNYDKIPNWGGIFEAASLGTDANTIFLANPDSTTDLNFRAYYAPGQAVTLTARDVLKVGQWMHLAVTLDPAGNVTIYVNGVSVAARSNPAGKLPAAVARNRTYIGFGQVSQLTPMPGRMGETRLWNVARTPQQIRGSMLTPLVGNESGLVGYWKLADIGAGGVTTDSSPTHLNGTVRNADSSNLKSSGLTSVFQPWASLQARQQVPQFIMRGPLTLQYGWAKENSVRVGVSPSTLESGVRTASDAAAYSGSGEYWFPTGTRVKIYAPLKPTSPVGYQLSTTTGQYIGGYGNIVSSTGNGLVDPADSGQRYVEIASLTQGSALTWNYAERVYVGSTLAIGNALDGTRNPVGAVVGTFAGDPIPGGENIDLAKPPTGTTIISNAPPGSTVQDMWIWDDVEKRLYPLRPGSVRLEWARQGGGNPVITEVQFAFPSEAYFPHIANTPPVPLDEDKADNVALVGLKYSERSTTVVNDAEEFSVNDAQFTAPYWSVLVFSQTTDQTVAVGDLTREKLLVRTVQTRRYSDGMITRDAVVGTPITSSAHSTLVPHNGYVYWEKARYNPNIYNRASRLGPIIPVNIFPTAKPEEKLVVVWYTQKDKLNWPAKAMQYNPAWPQDGNRIVIASRLGSEGLSLGSQLQTIFSPERYSDVQVYNQPDRNRPGFNPNEEHAVMAPSLVNVATPTPAAFALRRDLNWTTPDPNYTSDPYVLVQYFDRSTTNYGMAAYQVQVQDVNVKTARLVFNAGSSGALNLSLGAGNVVEFNFTAGPYSQMGLQPNEVVDLDPNDNLPGLNGGRYRVSIVNNGPPAKFVLVPLVGGAPVTASGIVPSENPTVVLTRAFPYVFEYTMKAGEPVLAPYPLQQVIGASACAETHGENLDPSQLVYWEDHKKQPWAVSGSDSPTAGLRAQFYYPLAPDFWHPTKAPGDCLAYVSSSEALWVTNRVTWPANVPVLKAGETLTYSGGEINRDDANRPGVPGVVGWAAGKVVFDQANPAMAYSKTVANYLARVASPLLTVEVSLPVAKLPTELLPASGNVTVVGTGWTFNKLDASLQPRIRYDQSSQKLSVRGFLDGKTLGDPALTAAPGSIYVLQPNILTDNDRAALLKLVDTASLDWTAAVSNLVQLSRDPKQAAAGGYGVGLEPVVGAAGQARPAVQFGPGLALLPNQALLDPAANLPEGYVTLAENDDDSLGAAPVALHIIRIRKQPLFRGAIKTLSPTNPFDEKITLRHSADFGGNAADLDFEWYYRPDDGQVLPPPDTAPTGSWALFADPGGKQGRGLQEINLAGAGAVTLTDNRFFVHWKHHNAATWSQWAGAANSRPPATNELAQNTYVPQLAEGWVKRVIAGINPFDARVTDFRNNNTPATYASMVQQAGAPYRGPVALNADPAVIQNTGLIELYTTVINRAKALSIDLSSPISTPALNNTLLLAASRIADLQLLLGNEAYTDAQDPTIGFGSSSVEYGALAPTIFTFQNQVATLLDEELALLRGRSEEGAYPAYNRLLWNFTRAEGEAAYALSYNVSDVNQDGFINEADARILYPQGHGDAWGNYLSALRTYYDLLRHPNYNWQARSENLQIEGVVVAVDYLDERKFAQAAAAKAKAGSEVVNLTYRSRYVEDPDGQWQGYQDTDANRAWGVSDWARRAGTGALLDWVTANAILPSSNTNKTGIERVDRSTVKELAQIAAQAAEVRKQLDNANTGLNPVGLATDVVPFDIDPVGFDSSTGTRSMHFDQVYDRALKALQNALDVFNNANQINNMLRQVAETADQFARDAAEQDLDFRNRLIEIFGTPYEGVIGPGKAYPAGYTGPDIYLHMYTDVTGIKDVPAPSTNFTAYFGQIPGAFVAAVGETQAATSITTAWSSYFAGDAPNIADNTNTDFSTRQLALKLPQTASGYSFQAPSDWGQRRAPGELQQILSEMVQAEADLQLALHDYDGLIGDLGDMTQLIQAQSNLQAENIRIQEAGRDRTIGLNTGILVANSVAGSMTLAAETVEKTTDVVASALPKVVGLASDALSTVRSMIEGAGNITAGGLKSTAFVSEQAAAFLESTKEVAQIQQDIAIQKLDFKYAIQEQLKEFESLLGDESAKRIEVFRKQEALRQVSDKYRATLETGLRLLEERALHNRQSAGATQKNRYQDFTFRVARNDALSKYRAAFDLAARYAYLAAKAYDYETNLDPNDSASARPALTQIIRAQTLGAVDNGEPRLGSGGLADALATLKVNFEVLRSQMGFNNPQGESGQFSLRHELFRLKGTNDVAWRQELERYRVADLWQVPEFRRYCRPFAPQSAGTQAGMVIPFGSQIIFGRNFFGKPLGPGDSAYDPTLFATKVRSVGVWFDNYAGEGLGTTPRVYLVPAGLDIMYVPSSAEFATREWNVVDQKIPVPLPVSQASLRDPSWIPLRDSVNGNIAEIRRYSSFRAFHNAGFTPDQMSFDSRLVGRSVWNTRWLLIIPGGTFLADQTEGLDTFIYGLKSTGGTATDSRGNRRDGNGVSDIKLSFQTYAISGN